MQHSTIISSPIGKIGLIVDRQHLIQLDFLPSDTPVRGAADETSQHICREIEKYFSDPNSTLSGIIYTPQGTPYQQKVWHALTTIPAGTTLTYGELAQTLQTSPRALGQACRKNPIPLLVPCHRVVAAHHIGGYAGARSGELLNIKTWLLRHEGAIGNS